MHFIILIYMKEAIHYFITSISYILYFKRKNFKLLESFFPNFLYMTITYTAKFKNNLMLII